MQARRFYLDTQNRNFVVSPLISAAVSGGMFFQEDVETIELFFLEPQNVSSATTGYRFVDYSSANIKLAVGLTAPAALQTSWTSVSTAITASITTLTNGSSGSNEVQKLTFSGEVAVQGNYSLTIPSRNITVSSVSAGVFTAANHGLLDGQSVTLSAFSISSSSFENSSYIVSARTKDTFRITTAAGAAAINALVTSGGGTAIVPAITTPPINFDATAQQVSQAFVDAGIVFETSPQIIVTGDYLQGFTFVFANTQAKINFDPMTVSSTLAAAPKMRANVSFNTSEVAALIAAGTTSNLKFEVEVSDGTRRHTYQTSCSLADDIVSSTSPTPAPANTSFTLQSPNGSNYTVTIDNDGILTTTKN